MNIRGPKFASENLAFRASLTVCLHVNLDNLVWSESFTPEIPISDRQPSPFNRTWDGHRVQLYGAQFCTVILAHDSIFLAVLV